MKKTWIRTWIILGIIVIIALAINFFGPKATETETTEMTTAETTDIVDPCDPQTEVTLGINISGDSVIRMHEEIARLRALLEVCYGNTPTKASTTKKSTGTTDSNKKTTPAAPAKNSSKSSSTPAASASQSTNPTIATNQYIGDVIGDGGCSFDPNSKLFFYVKTILLDSINGRNQNWSSLNSKTGPKGEKVGEYTYYRTPVIVLNNMLNEEWGWTAYVGDHTQYGYDMWLWHEIVKLNANLINDPQIQDNGLGGYKFVSKINYHSK